jgi:hypothetical protein
VLPLPRRLSTTTRNSSARSVFPPSSGFEAGAEEAEAKLFVIVVVIVVASTARYNIKNS